MKPMLSAALLVGSMLGDGLAFAHHGRGNRYDMDAQIELRGTVKELVWRNPHIAVLVDVPGDDGAAVTWIIEHSNVSTLARLGYHRNSLRPGQTVTVFANPGTTGEPLGLCQRLVLEDGSVIFVRGAGVD
ncbi:MAG TPA: DUF6152 family protein [Gammaproteobacteria bacterium]|jgi:hypothetical protein